MKNALTHRSTIQSSAEHHQWQYHQQRRFQQRPQRKPEMQNEGKKKKAELLKMTPSWEISMIK